MSSGAALVQLITNDSYSPLTFVPQCNTTPPQTTLQQCQQACSTISNEKDRNDCIQNCSINSPK